MTSLLKSATSLYPTSLGYMTEITRLKYIKAAVSNGLLPENAHRMADVISLEISDDSAKPIQFWQLYSVLGQEPIVRIVGEFYQRVFADENWFRSVFEKVGGVNHHINTQASMWIDVMGGGPYYHGGDFRLNFHHTHNAHQLMDEKGAKRWVELMVATLDANTFLHENDPRIRKSINTFLNHFFAKYADDFKFDNRETFGDTNAPYRRKINFMNMTEKAIADLSLEELKSALEDRDIDVSRLETKQEMINKALSL